MNKASQKRQVRAKGFTLIELMIVIVIAAILLTIAVPSFDSVMKKNSAEALQSRIASALSTARTEAASRNSFITICSSTDGATCDGEATDWGQGWIIFEDESSASVTAPDAANKIVIDVFESDGNYAVKADQKAMVFNTQGFSLAGNTNTFTICPPGDDISYARGLIVNRSGLIVKIKDTSTLSCP